jgi:hypothetical protein
MRTAKTANDISWYTPLVQMETAQSAAKDRVERRRENSIVNFGDAALTDA